MDDFSEFDKLIIHARVDDIKGIKKLLLAYNNPSFLVRLYEHHSYVFRKHDFILEFLYAENMLTLIIERAIDLNDTDFLTLVCSDKYRRAIKAFEDMKGSLVYRICVKKGRHDLFLTILSSLSIKGLSFHTQTITAVLENSDRNTIEYLIKMGFRITSRELFLTFGILYNSDEITPLITRQQMNMFDYLLQKTDDLTQDEGQNNILSYIIHYKRGDPSVRIVFKKLIEKEPRLKSMFLFHECQFVPSNLELEYYFVGEDSLASQLGINVNTLAQKNYVKQETVMVERGFPFPVPNTYTVKYSGRQTLLQKFLSPLVQHQPELFDTIQVVRCTRWLLSHGARETINHIDAADNTALFYACLHDNLPLLLALIKNGARIEDRMVQRLITRNLWNVVAYAGAPRDIQFDDEPEPAGYEHDSMVYEGYYTVSQAVYDFMHNRYQSEVDEIEAKLAMLGSPELSDISQKDILHNILSFLSGHKGFDGIDMARRSENEKKITLRRLHHLETSHLPLEPSHLSLIHI